MRCLVGEEYLLVTCKNALRVVRRPGGERSGIGDGALAKPKNNSHTWSRVTQETGAQIYVWTRIQVMVERESSATGLLQGSTGNEVPELRFSSRARKMVVEKKRFTDRLPLFGGQKTFNRASFMFRKNKVCTTWLRRRLFVCIKFVTSVDRNMTAAVILQEVERRTLVPRDMIRLVHKGKMISGEKSMKENNIEAKETIEMSLRLLGGMDVSEQMDTHETEEDREKKRKLDEGKEGKMTKANEDMAHLKRDIMEAFKKSDEKMDSYSRKTDEKIESYSKRTEERMNDFSSKADDLLEKFMKIPNTVGNKIHGMNSSIVKLQETNEKMKEGGENKFNKIDERFMDMEKKILDLAKKYENRCEENKQENENANQSETVITGLHSETKESEVTDMLKEMMNEIGMDFGSVKLACPAKPITHAFIYFANDNERNKFIRSANMLKKELRGRKIRITRSMEAEERFCNKRLGYIKSSIHKKHGVPLEQISLNWNTKHVSVKGQMVVKTCLDGSLKFNKYQDVEDEVDELMQKWQTKNSSQRL